jgi:ribosomal protein RSM22 (predicted rRNA methylase)
MGPFNDRRPAKLSSLVLRTLERLSQGDGARSNRIAQTVAELSRLFTKDRAALSRSYLDDPKSAAAYCAYFLPINLAKIQVLLDELTLEGIAGEEESSINVLDLGSGPGTGWLAVLDWLHHQNPELARRLSVMAVDSSAGAVRIAQNFWDAYCQEAGIVGATHYPYEGNLERAQKESWRHQAKERSPFDLIIMANCLNELFAAALDPIVLRAQLVANLLPLLKPHGTMMLVEPALRQTSRALHQVRDRLLQEQRCTVYSPCLHERNCPALVNPDDWCHEERAWEPPTAIKQIDDEVGFIKDALKFSYLMLRTDGLTITSRGSNTFRVVSELRELKGDSRAWLCNELGRFEVGKLERAKSATNAPWEGCQRGTIVKIEGLRRKEGGTLTRIPEDSRVEIIRST